MLKYRYPGEEWIEIDGDNWKIEPDCNEINDIYFSLEVTWAVNIKNSKYPDRDYNYGHSVGDTCNLISQRRLYGKILTHQLRPVPTDSSQSGRPVVEGTIEYFDGSTGSFIDEFYIINKTSGNVVGFSPSYRVPEIGRYGEVTNPRNLEVRVYESGKDRDEHRVCQGCKFTVFKNSSIIFYREDVTCPEIETATQQCPENTCEVECGDTICCYGSDGISVFNFPKS